MVHSCQVLPMWMQRSSEDVPAACLYWASFALCLPAHVGLCVLLAGFASRGLFAMDQQRPYP